MEAAVVEEVQQEQQFITQVSDGQKWPERDTTGRIDYWELLAELRIG